MRGKMTDCRIIKERLKNAFDWALMEAIENGEPAERRVSDYEYLHNYKFVEEAMQDAIDEVGRDALKRCAKDGDFERVFEDAMDEMEAHWQQKVARGQYEDADKNVEPF